MKDMEWDGRSKGSKSGYAIFVAMLRAGLAPAYILLIFVSLYYFIAERRKSSVVYRFYRKRTGFGVCRSIISVYRNYYIFGQCLIDRVAVIWNNSKFRITFEGEHHLIDMANRGKGGLLVGAHLGNWEIAGNFLYRIKVPVNIVVFDNEYENIKTYLHSVKTQTANNEFFYKIIPLKDDFSHLYLINEALSKGEFVCLHADRYFDNSKLIYRDFLGEEAPFSEAVFRMCVLFKVPVTFVYAFKRKFMRYHFYASCPKIYTGTKDEKLSEFANDYIAELENKTRDYPLHWFNFYNFWNNNR
jgi:predicted LPLAT superfamily acyltransferase